MLKLKYNLSRQQKSNNTPDVVVYGQKRLCKESSSTNNDQLTHCGLRLQIFS